MKPNMKLYSMPRRGSDYVTFRVWEGGESCLVGLRAGKVWGFYFKGYWHGSHKHVWQAFRAWQRRPAVGNQGIIADTSEPLALDDLDMSMF